MMIFVTVTLVAAVASVAANADQIVALVATNVAANANEIMPLQHMLLPQAKSYCSCCCYS